MTTTISAIRKTNAIEVAAAAVMRDYASVGDMSAQIAALIDTGRGFVGLPDVDKNAETRIHGCQSQLWLKAERDGDVMRFGADSDSLVMRGLLAIVLQIYEGRRLDEILHYDPNSVDNLILTLAPSRASGLRSLKRRIIEATEAAL
jgi:cysteine desulfuration protein SufE